MSQYTNLLATINAQIKANGVGAITGPLLNAVLRQMVSVLGDGYRLVGVAAPGDNPGTPDNQVAYLAGQDGTYTNFGGITLSGEVALLVWGASWSKQSLFSIDSAVTPGSGNPVSSDAVNAALAALEDEYQKLVPTAVEGHLAEFDGSGQVRDAGVSLDELPANFAACIYDRRSAGTPQSPYTFRQSGGDGVNYLKSIKGRTLVWNQLVQNGDFSTNTKWRSGASGNSLTYGTKMVTLTCTIEQSASGVISQPIDLISGHTYIVTYDVKCSKVGNYFGGYLGSPTQWLPSFEFTGQRQTISALITAAADKTYLHIGPYKNSHPSSASFTNGDTVEFYSCYLIDLTLLGWVPSSASEFRAVYPLSYYSYTPALLINNAATDLESTGFNQWDEEWEDGAYNTSTGEKIVSAGYIRSVNAIKVLPGVNYYIKKTATFATRVLQYDSSGNYLGYYSPATAGAGEVLSFVENTAYVRFHIYQATYNHDICINISDPSRNGTYEPYWKATRHLGLDNIQAKEVGSDTIVTINGLDGVGDNVDLLKDGKTLIKNRARVDLGDLNWTAYRSDLSPTIYPYGFAGSVNIPGKKGGYDDSLSSKYAVAQNGSFKTDKTIVLHESNDTAYVVDSSLIGKTAAEVKAALSGVILDYPLATPKEYELVEPIQPMLEVDELGTEKRLPEDTADAVNAPFESDSNYSVSVANLVRKLSE